MRCLALAVALLALCGPAVAAPAAPIDWKKFAGVPDTHFESGAAGSRIVDPTTVAVSDIIITGGGPGANSTPFGFAIPTSAAGQVQKTTLDPVTFDMQGCPAGWCPGGPVQQDPQTMPGMPDLPPAQP